MPEQHRALDWLARRHAGESAALIAWRAGVSEKVVLHATKRFGPFPRPSQQLGRTTVSDDRQSVRAREWVRQRRRGRTTTELAHEHGLSHQIVSRATHGYGPFPSPDTIEAWVAARQQRRTLAEIGAEYGVPATRVGHYTSAAGPFPPCPGGPRLPPGLLGVAALADRVGLSVPTVLRWRKAGRLPAPDFVTAKGRDLWTVGTIETWLGQAEFETCSECGAKCVSAARHRGARHI